MVVNSLLRNWVRQDTKVRIQDFAQHAAICSPCSFVASGVNLEAKGAVSQPNILRGKRMPEVRPSSSNTSGSKTFIDRSQRLWLISSCCKLPAQGASWKARVPVRVHALSIDSSSTAVSAWKAWLASSLGKTTRQRHCGAPMGSQQIKTRQIRHQR